MIESEWVTDEFRDCIKRRNKLNREKRWCKGEDRVRKVAEWKAKNLRHISYSRFLKVTGKQKKHTRLGIVVIMEKRFGV